MIRNTLTYKFTFWAGLALVLYCICYVLFFTFGHNFIEHFNTLYYALSLSIRLIALRIILFSTGITTLLIFLDCIFWKQKSPPKRVHKLRIIIESLFIIFYLYNATISLYLFITQTKIL